ncbi:MAG: MATE family efflux transporter [Chloroflexi bacterium]|nr:MATE family efflux transporter [Chloroflexota bacterium]
MFITIFAHWRERLNFFRKFAPGETISLNRQLFSLAWPSLIENLLQTMLGVVDLIFVGKLGADAIAGIGLGNQLMFTLVVAFMGLGVGTTALVARAIGAQNPHDAQRIAKQSLWLTAALSFAIAVLGALFGESVLHLMGATPPVAALGGQFLKITALFSIFIGVMFVGGGILRGAGDTRTPMLITAFINGVNIVLDYGLIFGNFGLPQMGAIGSAYATTTARGVGAILILYALFYRNRALVLPRHGAWKISLSIIRRILHIGLPAAGENIIFQLGLLVFSAMIVGLGTADIAAMNVSFSIMTFSILPAFAFGIAATTMVGQSLGAENVPRAEASARQALKSGTMWMCAMGVLFIVAREPLMRLYTTEAEVVALGSVLLILIGLMQPFQATAIILGSALRGAGDTRATLLISTLSTWGLRVGLGYVFGIAFGLGLTGIWLGWCADFFVRALLIALRFRRGKWKTLRV